jgi:hypothetical protein
MMGSASLQQQAQPLRPGGARGEQDQHLIRNKSSARRCSEDPRTVVGLLDPAFGDAQLNATVQALAVQPNGKIVLGGAFTTLGGQPRNRLARLNPDSSLDAAFNPGLSLGSEAFSNGVLALTVQRDGAILVSGEFSSIAGAPQAHRACLTPAYSGGHNHCAPVGRAASRIST